MMDGLIERGNPFICVLAVEIPDLNIKHIQNFIMCRPILDAELLIHTGRQRPIVSRVLT